MTNPEHTLLIVEDDTEVSEMLEVFFQAEGYQVLATPSGEQALEVCKRVHPNLILLDIVLPDVDGYAVAEKLRSQHQTGDIPIIFLTAQRKRDDRLRGLWSGADDYLTKPFDFHELRLRVQNAIQRKQRQPVAHPVSGLPYGAWLDEILSEQMNNGGWQALVIELQNLEEYQSQMGFLAADEAVRATAIVIQNALRESGLKEFFLGQVDDSSFVILAAAAVLPSLKERITQRLNQTVPLYYPIGSHANLERRDDNPSHRLSPTALTEWEALKKIRRASPSYTPPPVNL